MKIFLPFFLVFLELYATTLAAAPPLALPSSQPSSSIPEPNVSSPFNVTQPTSLGLLPKDDPSTYAIPSSSETLTFFMYGREIPRGSVLDIFQAANRDVAFNVKKGNPMGRMPLRYTAGNIHLLVHVNDQMKWDIWGTVIRGLEEWFEKWEYVECDVDIGKVGALDYWYGTGVFVMIDKDME